MGSREAELKMRAETTTTNAIACAAAAIEATSRAAELLSTLAEARQQFLNRAGQLLEDPEHLFADRFPSPAAYYAFLARMGRSSGQDPYDADDTTSKVAQVIKQLHVPGTLVYLKTEVRGRPHSGSAYAVGKVAGVPRPHIVTDHLSLSTPPELILAVQTETANGRPKRSEVGIDDIALGFDRDTLPGSASPLIAVGSLAVKKQAERVLDASDTFRGVWGSPWEERPKVLGAMCAGGVRLAELGFTPRTIADYREQAIAGLREVSTGDKRYASEVLVLPAVCETNEEALAIVDEILPGSDHYATSLDLGSDYQTLWHYQRPAEVPA